MIFQRAALREFTQTGLAVFVALFSILVTTQLIRLLGQAAGGKISSEAVFGLLSFSAINTLPVLLSPRLSTVLLVGATRATVL